MTRTLMLLAPLVAGCAFDEGLVIENLKGTVRIPRAAAQREIVDPNAEDGSTILLDDPRLIGPVYLGLYPSVYPADVVGYPHPEMGPVFQRDIPGNAYPYGGTTVGDLRFACFDFLTCKHVSGRFTGYQDMIDWYERLGQPILDAAGAVVPSGEFIQQTCFDILNVTSDEEVRILTDDKDGDGKLEETDLDFVLDESTDEYVAEFTIWQQEMFWDQEVAAKGECTPGRDCPGFTLWGWMDAPSITEYTYSTCNPDIGFENTEYNANFSAGAPFTDLLNFPSSYIGEGDWVSGEAYRWDDRFAEPELRLDFVVE